LEGKKSPRALRFELEKMRIGPKASGSAYDSAYDEAMQRIMGQVPDRKSLAWGVLSWTTCAKRPLTATELLNALAVELDEPEFYEDNIPDLEDIISVCAGLITVSSDASGEIVQLVHYTTQEYFERTWELWFPDAHCNIATICVTYLSFDVFQTGYCLTDADLESRLEEYPFYSYAAKSWGDHSRVQPISQDLMTAFLQDLHKVNASVQAILARKGFSSIGEYSQQIPFGFTSFHLAAYFGLVDTMQSMIQSGYPYMVQCSMERTSLAWAAYAGHIEPVKLLLSLGMSPIDYDYDGQSPITLAASMGCADIVILLLEHGAHVDSKDITGQTCLSLAAYRGHERVVEILLNKGANPEYKDETGQSPLSWAASNGWVAVALLLLERSVDLESKDMFGRTPLSCAAENGHINMLTLLIQRGAEPDSKDAGGHTPLFWASHYGHETVVRLLQQQPPITQAPISNDIDSMIQDNAEQFTHQNPFDNWSRMRSRSRRATLRKNPTGQTQFHCPLCLDKVHRTTYSSARTFERHVYNRHYARFEYQCPAAECFDSVSGKSQVFTRKDNLRAHVLRVHKLDLKLADRDKWLPQNPSPKTCPVCQVSIASWEAFHSCILSHSCL
jgi:ankyrin repeat protein